MRAKLEEVRIDGRIAYCVSRNGESIWKAIITTSHRGTKTNIVVSKNEQELYYIRDTRRPYSYNIYTPDGEQVGRLFRRIERWFVGPTYYVIELHGKQYSMYCVGLGKQGRKFPIFNENEEQVCLLEKGVVVRNALDVYDLFSIDDDSAFIGMLFGIVFDWREHRRDNRPRESVIVSAKIVFTTNESVKAKYNPTFQDTCPP